MKKEKKFIIIGFLLDFTILDSNSLKDKRQVIQSIIDRIKNKFNCSISEIDYLDTWHKARIGISLTSNDSKILIKIKDKILNLIEKNYAIEIINFEFELFYF